VKLPNFPDGLTPEFLTLLLVESLLADGGRVTEVVSSPMAEGAGMMAEIAKLMVTYENAPANLPTSIVAKFASSNPTNREIALSYNVYEREARYYSELDPRTEAVGPQIYFSQIDGENLLILMEDLSDYEVGSQIAGATLEQTELAIDELAKLHGAFWGRVETLDWVPGIADSYHADTMLALALAGWDKMVDTYGNLISEYTRGQKDAFLSAIPALQKERNTQPRTLCHGDFRMENLLYGTRPGQHPVVVIDWQGPLRCHGMFDVALFLGQSTKTMVRREHELALLQRYTEGLERAGVDTLDASGVWEDYRRTMLYDWVYTAVVTGSLDVTNETTSAWMAKMVARQSAASEDLNVFELLP